MKALSGCQTPSAARLFNGDFRMAGMLLYYFCCFCDIATGEFLASWQTGVVLDELAKRPAVL